MIDVNRILLLVGFDFYFYIDKIILKIMIMIIVIIMIIIMIIMINISLLKQLK